MPPVVAVLFSLNKIFVLTRLSETTQSFIYIFCVHANRLWQCV